MFLCPTPNAPAQDKVQAGNSPDDVTVAEGIEWFGVPDAKPWLQWQGVTGDWAGIRTKLEDVGLSIAGEYVGEFSRVTEGGVKRAGSFRNLLTLDVELDMEKVFVLKGATFFMQYLQVNKERGGSMDSGDIQVYSNIENDRSLNVIYELWYEQLLMDDQLRIKVGKVDANSEFNFVDAAGDFSNSSAGFTPTIFAFPSYPDPAMSINIFFTLIDTDDSNLTLGYGFYDGAVGVDGIGIGSRGPSTFFSDDRSNDYFHIAEAALTWDSLCNLYDGRFSVGGWWHDGEFGRFDGGMENGTGGFYLTFEQRIFAPNGQEDDRGVYLFGQYSYADEKVSEIQHHIAGGIVARGICGCRPDDAAGVYLSFVDLSDDQTAGFTDDEFVIDAYYRVQITPAIFIQPEIQYIINPSGDPAVDDALVVGGRIGINF